jgi:hypothetical protein
MGGFRRFRALWLHSANLCDEMPNNDRTRIIQRRTPESAAMLANVKRAMAITAKLNRLTFNDTENSAWPATWERLAHPKGGMLNFNKSRAYGRRIAYFV